MEVSLQTGGKGRDSQERNRGISQLKTLGIFKALGIRWMSEGNRLTQQEA